MGKKIYVSVINDLSTDQRVHKICSSLHEDGHEIVLVGRRLNNSAAIDRDYHTKRMRLLFTKGALFYATFNFRLFFFLLFRRMDVLYANDLDTLLANYLVSRIKRKPMIYDSHECFTEVPELEGRKFAKGMWLKIERWIFPKLKHVYTVNDSIASFYQDRYNLRPKVMRNIPHMLKELPNVSREQLGLPTDKHILILQGSGINVDRGGEELLEALALLDNCVLLIVGSGDVINSLKTRAQQDDLQGKVIFKDRMPYTEMMKYTVCADLGVTLDKPSNLNYKFSLPNKIFDYISAGIPILSSDLPELRKVIENYEVGVICPSHDIQDIASCIQNFLKDKEKLDICRSNTANARAELSWNNEVSDLKAVMKDIGKN